MSGYDVSFPGSSGLLQFPAGNGPGQVAFSIMVMHKALDPDPVLVA